MGLIDVQCSEVTGTGSVAFIFDAPVATSFLGAVNAPLSGGSAVHLSGFNFGTDDYTPAISSGGTACATAMWMTSTVLQCASTTQWFPGHPLLHLEITTLVATATGTFSWDAPIISAAQPVNFALSAGNAVTIMGMNFGPDALTRTLHIGSTSCIAGGWISETSLTCAQALVAESSHQSSSPVALLSFDGLSCSSVVRFSFDAPVITASNTRNFPYCRGDGSIHLPVFLEGMNFGGSDLSPVTSVGNSICSSQTWFSDTAVTCHIAAHHPGGDVVISVSSVLGTLRVLFSFDAPAMTSVSPLPPHPAPPQPSELPAA